MHAYVTGRIDTGLYSKCLEHPGDGLFHIRRCDRGRCALRRHDEMDDLSAPRWRVEPLRPIGIVPCSSIAGWNPIVTQTCVKNPPNTRVGFPSIKTCDFPRLSVPVTTLRTIGLAWVPADYPPLGPFAGPKRRWRGPTEPWPPKPNRRLSQCAGEYDHLLQYN